MVVGEEDGGLGAFGTLKRGHRGAACVIAEPTSGTITAANAGAWTFELAVTGRATHASTSYAGVSALDTYLPLHAALADLQRRRYAVVDPLMDEYPIAYPLLVGRVTCGDWASSVPDRLVAEDGSGWPWTRIRCSCGLPWRRPWPTPRDRTPGCTTTPDGQVDRRPVRQWAVRG